LEVAIDGDIVGSTPAKIQLRPGHLRVLSRRMRKVHLE